jgi:hypothetical protein
MGSSSSSLDIVSLSSSDPPYRAASSEARIGGSFNRVKTSRSNLKLFFWGGFRKELIADRMKLKICLIGQMLHLFRTILTGFF